MYASEHKRINTRFKITGDDLGELGGEGFSSFAWGRENVVGCMQNELVGERFLGGINGVHYF